MSLRTAPLLACFIACSALGQQPTPLVAEVVNAGVEYVEARTKANQILNQYMASANEKHVAFVVRSQIVRLDQDAMARLFHSVGDNPVSLEEAFTVTVFFDKPCVFSSIGGVSRTENPEKWMAGATCDNVDARLTVYSGNDSLVLRYLDHQDLRITPIAETELFVAWELDQEIRGPVHY